MRILLLLFLTFISFSLQSQKLSEQVSDSIESVIDSTYMLNDKSEYGKAIQLTNQLHDYLEKNPDDYLLSKLYGSLSYSYAELKDKDKAFYYANKSIEHSIVLKDTANIILSYNDLGVTYRDFKMYDKAKESFIKAAELSAIFGYDDVSTFPFYNLGGLLERVEHKYAEAEQYLLKSLEYAKKTDLDKNERIYVALYISLGVVNHKLKRYDTSNEYFNQAFEIASSNNYFVPLFDYYTQKARLYKDDKKYVKAISMIEKSIVIRDSIEKRKQIEIVKRVEAEYKIKESEEKLEFIEKESAVKELLFQKSKKYNWLLVGLSALLFVAVYNAFKNNKKLKVSKNQAIKLTKVKSDFYSEISHELRTPLYAVTELSSLLLKENVTETHKEYLESLNFSANHLIALVNNVLELNKVESGTLKVEFLNVNLESLFSNIINSLEYALLHSNNTISLEFDEDIPLELTGDSLKLSQVMINLISNAIKYTRNGRINVIVKNISETKDDVNLYIEVSDNGVGISEENQKKIFEAYYQEAYQPDNSFKGTGLGLSIVHRLLKVMGTQINFQSEINKGSKFFFELPFKKSTEISTIAKNNETLLERIKGLHFLIVDDNKINQLVTKKILESLEITFEIVNSGFNAIEVTKNKKFDCILMDIHMPEMSGYTAAKKIRVFNETIPIIAFTAANSEEVEERIKDSRMNGCIYKPFYSSDFIEKINEFVGINL